MSRYTDLTFINLGSSWSSGNIWLRSFYPGEESWNQMNRRPVRPQSFSRRFGEKKNFRPWQDRNIGQSRSLVAIPSMLVQLASDIRNRPKPNLSDSYYYKHQHQIYLIISAILSQKKQKEFTDTYWPYACFLGPFIDKAWYLCRSAKCKSFEMEYRNKATHFSY